MIRMSWEGHVPKQITGNRYLRISFFVHIPGICRYFDYQSAYTHHRDDILHHVNRNKSNVVLTNYAQPFVVNTPFKPRCVFLDQHHRRRYACAPSKFILIKYMLVLLRLMVHIEQETNHVFFLRKVILTFVCVTHHATWATWREHLLLPNGLVDTVSLRKQGWPRVFSLCPRVTLPPSQTYSQTAAAAVRMLGLGRRSDNLSQVA